MQSVEHRVCPKLSAYNKCAAVCTGVDSFAMLQRRDIAGRKGWRGACSARQRRTRWLLFHRQHGSTARWRHLRRFSRSSHAGQCHPRGRRCRAPRRRRRPHVLERQRERRQRSSDCTFCLRPRLSTVSQRHEVVLRSRHHRGLLSGLYMLSLNFIFFVQSAKRVGALGNKRYVWRKIRRSRFG